MSTDNFQSASWKLLGWLLDIIAISALAFSIHLHQRIASLELWQAETRANRYTSVQRMEDATKDAAEKQALWKAMNDMQSQWLKEIGQINVALAEIKAGMKANERRTPQ